MTISSAAFRVAHALLGGKLNPLLVHALAHSLERRPAFYQMRRAELLRRMPLPDRPLAEAIDVLDTHHFHATRKDTPA
jgi:hypothetical protein